MQQASAAPGLGYELCGRNADEPAPRLLAQRARGPAAGLAPTLSLPTHEHEHQPREIHAYYDTLPPEEMQIAMFGSADGAVPTLTPMGSALSTGGQMLAPSLVEEARKGQPSAVWAMTNLSLSGGPEAILDRYGRVTLTGAADVAATGCPGAVSGTSRYDQERAARALALDVTAPVIMPVVQDAATCAREALQASIKTPGDLAAAEASIANAGPFAGADPAIGSGRSALPAMAPNLSGAAVGAAAGPDLHVPDAPAIGLAPVALPHERAWPAGQVPPPGAAGGPAARGFAQPLAVDAGTALETAAASAAAGDRSYAALAATGTCAAAAAQAASWGLAPDTVIMGAPPTGPYAPRALVSNAPPDRRGPMQLEAFLARSQPYAWSAWPQRVPEWAQSQLAVTGDGREVTYAHPLLDRSTAPLPNTAGVGPVLASLVTGFAGTTLKQAYGFPFAQRYYLFPELAPRALGNPGPGGQALSLQTQS